MRRSLKLLVLSLILLAASPLRAEEFTAQPVSIPDFKLVFATVQTRDVLLARARIGGTIGALAAQEGAKVGAGERIGSVGDPKLILQMNGAEAKAASARAERDQARIDLDRAQELRASGAGTQARLDNAKTRFDVTEKNLAAARSETQVLAQRLAEGAVLAPGAGRILKIPVANGSVVMPGETIAVIAAEHYVLRLMLPERHARFIKVGDPVRVAGRGLDNGLQSDLREGRIVLVYPELDQGRVVADAEVDGLGDYFVGERARVAIATGKRETFVVPPAFIFRRFGVAYVRLKDGPEVAVQPGLVVDGGIEVLSGLKPGDVLVTP